jgi:hypothetical protein
MCTTSPCFLGCAAFLGFVLREWINPLLSFTGRKVKYALQFHIF